MSSQVFSIRVNYGLSKQMKVARVMSHMPNKHVWIDTISNYHFEHNRLVKSNIPFNTSPFSLMREKVEKCGLCRRAFTTAHCAGTQNCKCVKTTPLRQPHCIDSSG